MKVLTFFTVRGGSGKTVIVLDFDGPEYNLYNMRARELDYMRGNGIKSDAADLRYLKDEFEYVVMDTLDLIYPVTISCLGQH